MTTCCATCYYRDMLKTYLYVPEELNEKIVDTAKSRNKSKAEVIREALEIGIDNIQAGGTASTEALLKIAEIGRINNVKGPKNAASNMDKYLWEKDWGKHEK